MTRYRIKRFAALTFTSPKTLQEVARETTINNQNLQAKLKAVNQGLVNDIKQLGAIRAAKPAPALNRVAQSIHAKVPVQNVPVKSANLRAGGTSISITTS